MRRRATIALVVAGLVAGGACTEPLPDKTAAKRPTSFPGRRCEAKAVVDCVPKDSTVAPYLPSSPTGATGTPIRIGTINQDTGAAGAFPELTKADQVAIDFINTELGGVDGHPLELVTCDTQFSPDLSQACAQEMVAKDVAAVVGGIDVWGTGITTLDNNGIPYVGGIPVSFEAARSGVSFQFSGGIWGAVLGEGEYAWRHRARRVAIIAADFGPITDAAELGRKALERHDVQVDLVSIAPINADMVQALNTASQSNPDAIIALTADSGCKPTMLTARQLGLKAPILYTGSCAAPNIVDSVNGAAEGAIFNVEANLGDDDPDAVAYQAITDRYGPKHGYEALSAGTVSFRAMMNLYTILRDIGGDGVTRSRILARFRAARERPSFMGHPYTCDGRQLAGYPALCSPQQVLAELHEGALRAVTGWLDVAAFAS